jgi:hypothetical protein
MTIDLISAEAEKKGGVIALKRDSRDTFIKSNVCCLIEY